LQVIAPLRDISMPMRALSTYIAGALDRPLPRPVAERARAHLLDTLAAAISGTQLRPGRLAVAYVESLGGARHSSILGTRLLTCPVHAALANGMLAHADETDDSHAPSRTHPGCAVVPAALAAGEAVHASGEGLLRAVVLGYDVTARINAALGADALAAAAHSTHSIGGTFGAGAAAAALLGLKADAVRHLLSLCAQQASGVGCHVRDAEHVEKAFDFGGMPARNGVTAATMAAAGFTGVDDVFSGERSFFDAYALRAEPEQLSAGLGRHFAIMTTNIKKWPVGSPAQAALDALAALIETEPIAPECVEAIHVHLPSRSARTVDNAAIPAINVQHLIAVLLIDRTLTFATIHDSGRMKDRAVLALRKKVVLIPSEELTQALPERQAIVAVKTRDGRERTRRAVAVRGTAANPMTQAEVEAKALDLIGGKIGIKRASAVIEAVRDIDAVADITTLRRLWQPPRRFTRRGGAGE
jgi:2-methylcitrate dehydratase PrpD